jgi:hypothetical protein
MNENGTFPHFGPRNLVPICYIFDFYSKTIPYLGTIFHYYFAISKDHVYNEEDR